MQVCTVRTKAECRPLEKTIVSIIKDVVSERDNVPLCFSPSVFPYRRPMNGFHRNGLLNCSPATISRHKGEALITIVCSGMLSVNVGQYLLDSAW